MTDSQERGTTGTDAGRSLRSGLFPTAILGLATLLAAWAFFQSSEWQRERFRLSDESLSRAEQVDDLERDAARLNVADQAIISQWLVSRASGDRVAADALILSLRPELSSQVSASIEQSPDDPIEAIRSFFESQEYEVNQLFLEAAQKTGEARHAERESRKASDRSSRYGLIGVIFAGGLLFAGLTPQLRGRSSTAALLLATGLLGVGIIGLSISPVAF